MSHAHASHSAESVNVSFSRTPIAGASLTQLHIQASPSWHEGTTSGPLAAIACFTFAREPPEETLPLVRMQLQQCGGYLVLSSYNDDANGVVRMHSGYDKLVGVAAGNEYLVGTSRILARPDANGTFVGNRLLFEAALNYFEAALAFASHPQFDWYVKVDPDTLFFPARLPALIAKLSRRENGTSNHWYVGDEVDPQGHALALGEGCVGLCGAVNALSASALRAILRHRKNRCHPMDPSTFYNEDLYLGECLKRLDIPILPRRSCCPPSAQRPRPECPLGFFYADLGWESTLSEPFSWRMFTAGCPCGHVVGVHALKTWAAMAEAARQILEVPKTQHGGGVCQSRAVSVTAAS